MGLSSYREVSSPCPTLSGELALSDTARKLQSALCLALLSLLLVPIACEPDPAGAIAEQSQFMFSPMDYDRTLNVNCVLNPDSSVQYLAVEQIAGRVERMYQYGIFFDRILDIQLSNREQAADFQRRWPSTLDIPAWDIYILPDSTMDIDYGRIYDLTIDLRSAGLDPFTGSTTVPGDFQITAPADSGALPYSDEIEIVWSPSDGAEGYVLFAKCYIQDLVIERSEMTTESAYTFPIGLTREIDQSQLANASYSIEVWAADETLMEYFRSVPFGKPFLDSGVSNAYGIFASTVIRRTSFSMGAAE